MEDNMGGLVAAALSMVIRCCRCRLWQALAGISRLCCTMEDFGTLLLFYYRSFGKRTDVSIMPSNNQTSQSSQSSQRYRAWRT